MAVGAGALLHPTALELRPHHSTTQLCHVSLPGSQGGVPTGLCLEAFSHLIVTSSFLFKILCIYLYWSIVDLWCCVSFRCPAPWFSYTFICVCTCSFSILFHYSLLLVSPSCLTLCDTMDCSLPGSSAHGILQARILEWVAMSSSRGSSRPRDQTQVSHTAGILFTIWAIREAPYSLLQDRKYNPLC